jgi:hypothetical protein
VETVRKMMDKSIDELKVFVETLEIQGNIWRHWENEAFEAAGDFIRNSQQVKLHTGKGNVMKKPDGYLYVPEHKVKYDIEAVDKDDDEDKEEYNKDLSDEESVWLDFQFGLKEPQPLEEPLEDHNDQDYIPENTHEEDDNDDENDDEYEDPICDTEEGSWNSFDMQVLGKFELETLELMKKLGRPNQALEFRDDPKINLWTTWEEEDYREEFIKLQ